MDLKEYFLKDYLKNGVSSSKISGEFRNLERKYTKSHLLPYLDQIKEDILKLRNFLDLEYKKDFTKKFKSKSA